MWLVWFELGVNSHLTLTQVLASLQPLKSNRKAGLGKLFVLDLGFSGAWA